MIEGLMYVLSFGIFYKLLTTYFEKREFQFKDYIKFKIIRVITIISVFCLHVYISGERIDAQKLPLKFALTSLEGIISAVLFRMIYGKRLNTKTVKDSL